MKPFPQRVSRGLKLGLSHAQATTLAKLKTPAQIQDFVNAIPTNFEPDGDTCLSASEAMRQRRAHCIEGAFIAACAFYMHGKPPLLMDFQARNDDDHVVALYRDHGCWGAISKSNHIWLRYRDPVYRNLRELAMSYFHEYIGRHRRTLWTYSIPFDLGRFDSGLWASGKEPCWVIADILDGIRHYRVITLAQAKNLRSLDRVEADANKLFEHRPPRKRRKNKAKS